MVETDKEKATREIAEHIAKEARELKEKAEGGGLDALAYLLSQVEAEKRPWGKTPRLGVRPVCDRFDLPKPTTRWARLGGRPLSLPEA